MSQDSHVSLSVIFEVPGDEDAGTHMASFMTKSKAGTNDLIYYGYGNGTIGNKILAREGYKNAEGFFSHVNEVKDELEDYFKKGGKEVKVINLYCIVSDYIE